MTLFVMDVDGTLTDGRIYISAHGEVMKAFDVKDGFGIRLLIDHNIIPVVITGRQSAIVEERCRELGITEVHQDVKDKLSCILSIVKKYGTSSGEVAYIGDDLNDLECIHYAGISACPADAWHSLKDEVSYVCRNRGGRGAVREFAELIVESRAELQFRSNRPV